MYHFESIVYGTCSISFWFLLKATTGRRPCVNHRRQCFTLDFREALSAPNVRNRPPHVNISLDIDSARHMKFKVKKSYAENWTLSSGSDELILETGR